MIGFYGSAHVSLCETMDTNRSNKKRPWWYLLIPEASAIDGNRLEFRWVRLSDLVIVMIMCAATYASVYILRKSGYLPRRWIDGDIVVVTMGWSLVFLGVAFLAFLYWQPKNQLPDSWQANAGITVFLLMLSGVFYLIFGHGNDGYLKGQLIYVPLLGAYVSLWSIPRALWRSSRPQRLSPIGAKGDSKPGQQFDSRGEGPMN